MVAGAVIAPIDVGYWIKAWCFVDFALGLLRFTLFKVNALAFTTGHRVGFIRVNYLLIKIGKITVAPAYNIQM